MISIKPIHYGSPAYLETLELRNRVMRLPLGLNIHDEDFSFEQNCVLYAAFDGEQVIGMGSMSREGDTCKVEYLCVDTAIQSRGLGRQLLEALEGAAREQDAAHICLDARVTAQHFYERAGYHTVGEIFLLSYAPVEHILMEKDL